MLPMKQVNRQKAREVAPDGLLNKRKNHQLSCMSQYFYAVSSSGNMNRLTAALLQVIKLLIN